MKDMTEQVCASTDINDITAGTLTQSILEAAAISAQANFGAANTIFLSPQMMSAFGGTWVCHPEFSPTPWSSKDRLSKREIRVATLQTFLDKLHVIKGEELHQEIYDVAVKRLKRAKWARYQKPKKV